MQDLQFLFYVLCIIIVLLILLFIATCIAILNINSLLKRIYSLLDSFHEDSIGS